MAGFPVDEKPTEWASGVPEVVRVFFKIILQPVQSHRRVLARRRVVPSRPREQS
jgi:hypothetical protein